MADWQKLVQMFQAMPKTKHSVYLEKLPTRTYCEYVLEQGIKQIVDLGSGSGAVASFLAKPWPQNPFVSVDPQETKSDFALYEDYLRACQKEHALLIHWPLPNHACYDIDALLQDKATFAIVVLETGGVAGGLQLLRLLGDLGLEYRSLQPVVLEDKYHCLRTKWRILQTSQIKTEGDPFGAYHYTAVLLQRV